jgi:hypothetical protein
MIDIAIKTSVLRSVFFRIGGATPGQATTSLQINSDNVIIDDVWAWRADHGTGVGWTSNTAAHSLIVNGDSALAYVALAKFAHPEAGVSPPSDIPRADSLYWTRLPLKRPAVVRRCYRGLQHNLIRLG